MTCFYYLSSLKEYSSKWEKVYEEACVNFFKKNLHKKKYANIELKVIRIRDIKTKIWITLKYIKYLNLKTIKDIIRLSYSQLFRKYSLLKLGILNKYIYSVLKNVLVFYYIFKSIRLYCDTIYFLKKNKVLFVIAEHIDYLNGSIVNATRDIKKPLFVENYPYGIRLFTTPKFEYSSNLHYFDYPNEVSIPKNASLKDTSKIPYLISHENNINLSNYCFKNYDYLFYIHSVSDTQNFLGWDGAFGNTLEFTLFTLSFLKNKKVLIKPHPNFYSNFETPHVRVDKNIYKLIVEKFNKNPNLFFLNDPIDNYELLEKINKDCIAITHHGTMIAECGAMNIKVISSKLHPIYNLDIANINQWENIKQYKKLLNTSFQDLKSPNIDYCNEIYNMYLNSPNSIGHISNWKNLLTNQLDFDIKDFLTNPIDIDPYLKNMENRDINSYQTLIDRISSESIYKVN